MWGLIISKEAGVKSCDAGLVCAAGHAMGVGSLLIVQLGGNLQIEFPYDRQRDLFIAFNCHREISHRYKYKFLKATTAQIPGSILKDNRGSKLSFGANGLLKVQHLISVKPALTPHQHFYDPSQAQARVSYIEFYVLPESESDDP